MSRADGFGGRTKGLSGGGDALGGGDGVVGGAVGVGSLEDGLQPLPHLKDMRIVRLLPNKGAKINAEGGNFGTAPLGASINGEESHEDAASSRCRHDH